MLWLKQTLKFVLALAIALALVLVVRAFAFTVCRLPCDFSQTYRRGDRVMVNRLSRGDLRRGELVAFCTDSAAVPCLFPSSGLTLGLVEAVPGDTIVLERRRFRIPLKCCRKCRCVDCKLYLVYTGKGRVLVHKHQLAGKAFRLL